MLVDYRKITLTILELLSWRENMNNIFGFVFLEMIIVSSMYGTTMYSV